MKHLQIAIDAGEKTCAREPGKWCKFYGASHWGSNPLCLLFRDKDGEPRRVRDEKGGVDGWMQRLPECLIAEQSAQIDERRLIDTEVQLAQTVRVCNERVKQVDDLVDKVAKLSAELEQLRTTQPHEL